MEAAIACAFKLYLPAHDGESSAPDREIPLGLTDLQNSYQCENWSIFIIDTIYVLKSFHLQLFFL